MRYPIPQLKQEEGPLVGLVSSAFDTHPRDVGAAEIVSRIRDGRYRAEIMAIRSAYSTGGKSAIKDLKTALPGVMWSGSFAYRNKTGLKAHSGLLCADLDAISTTGKTIPAVRAAIEADRHVWASFLSPSGDGLKVVCRVPPDAGRHEASFYAVGDLIRRLAGVEIDPSGKDVCRLCFVSCDPGLYWNPNAIELEVEKSEKNATYTVHNDSELGYCVTESLCIELLCRSFIPVAKKTNHRLLYLLSRKVKRLIARGQRVDSNAVFDYWWRYSQAFVDQEAGREAYYFEWTQALESKLGGPLWDAWEASEISPPPPQVELVETPEIKRLICWCYALSQQSGDGKFFLSCRMVMEFFNHKDHDPGYRWLGMLVKKGILEILVVGSRKTNLATEYRYRRATEAPPMT